MYRETDPYILHRQIIELISKLRKRSIVVVHVPAYEPPTLFNGYCCLECGSTWGGWYHGKDKDPRTEHHKSDCIFSRINPQEEKRNLTQDEVDMFDKALFKSTKLIHKGELKE